MLAVLAPLSVAAQTLTPLPPHSEGVAWPTDGWEEGDLPASIADEVTAIADEMMVREVGDVTGKTRALVIIHEGRLVLERYADGFGPETKQVSWSMAKSVTSALVGRVVQMGLIEDIDQWMPAPFEEDDPRDQITWRQWLTMTDGLDYLEIGSTGLADNDVVQMMYGPGRFDVAQYIVDELPPKYAPGTVWNYSTAGFHLIAWALDRAIMRDIELERPHHLCTSTPPIIGTDAYWKSVEEACLPMSERILYENWALRQAKRGYARNPDGVTKPIKTFVVTQLRLIGMDAQPEFDAAGTYLGGSLVWASARDFAKFGYLYLRDGVWEGERLLPEGWVDFSRTSPEGTGATVYGAGWWLGAAESPAPEGQAATTPPWDAFSAQGFEGQTLWIVPSRDLVIVRLGLMSNAGDNWPALYEWNQAIARLFPEIDSDG